MSRKVLILGASSTLGRQITAKMSVGGHQVWGTFCRQASRLLLEECSPGCRISQLDATSPSGIRSLRVKVNGEWGSLDTLVIAYGLGSLRPVQATSTKNVEALFQLNVFSLIESAREFLGLLVKGNQPSVVLLSSTMGLVGAGGMVAYSATKGAVSNLTRSLALEWAPRRIRVNAVAPGVIASPMVHEMFANIAEEEVRHIESRHPLGVGEAADVAEAVYFLASPKAKWITGVVLPVDGGYTAH